MREEPREALVPDGAEAIVPLHRHSRREEAGVDGEVRAAGGETSDGGDEAADVVVRPPEREHGGGGERRERERTDVEEGLMDRVPSSAPLNGCDRDREWERRPRAEHRRARECADRAHGDGVPLEPDRERLADGDGGDHRDEADEVLGAAEEEGRESGRSPRRCHERDERDESGREREEARTGGHMAAHVRPWLVVIARDRCGARPASREGRVARDEGEASPPFSRGEQGLGARVEDAVSPLALRAIDGEIRLVDERVDVHPILRVRGHAARDRRADRLARRLDLVHGRRNGAPDPLGDLERLLALRLGQQDGELLAAEARGHVVVAELRAEDVGDAAQHGVPCEVAVRVVDLP